MKPYIPMTDADQVLQASVTKTASFNSAWLDLGEGYDASGSIGQPVAAVVNVTAADRANSDETYIFKLQQTTPDANGAADDAAAADISPSVAVAVSGTDATLGNLVPRGLVTARFVRLVLTAAGTTPSITYSGKLGR